MQAALCRMTNYVRAESFLRARHSTLAANDDPELTLPISLTHEREH